MALLALAVVVGLVAGRLRPAAGARAVRHRFTWVPLLGVGAAANLLAYRLDGTAATLALAASLVALLAFAGVNTHLTGVAVIGVGLLANLTSVVLNEGMPVRGGALVAAGVVDEAELAVTGFHGPRHLETRADTVAVLGDVLPVPPLREVMSFGDLIVVFGAADAVRDLARRRRRPWTSEQRAAYRAELVDAPSPAPAVLPGTHELSGSGPDVIDLQRPAPTLGRHLVTSGSRG